VKRYQDINTFADNVADILALFADTAPRTFKDFLQYGFADPP
jgi:hypothetical protein